MVATLVPFSQSASANPGATNSTINFQGRLLSSAGAVMADGTYNMEFKIYKNGDGTAAADASGTPAGVSLWTEDWLVHNGTAVTIKNGYFSAQLGSAGSPLPSAITLNESVLFLSMNVAKGASATTDCGTASFSSCTADGEMLPMKSIGSTPYALNAANANQVNSYGSNNNFLNLAVPSGVGSALAAGTLTGTYFYVVTATNAQGETIASASTTKAPSSQGVTITWTAVPGATGYKIYRNTSNSFSSGSLLLTTLANGSQASYTDASGVTGAGLPPTTVTGTTATIQGWNGQTANLMQNQDSTGAIVSSFGANGQLVLGRAAVSGTQQTGSVGFTDGTSGASSWVDTLQATGLTGSHTITLPDAGGAICTNIAATCSGTYQAAGNYLLQNPVANDLSTSNFVGTQYSFTQSNAGAAGVLAISNAGTNSALSVTQTGNPTAGQALIFANNTNGAPTGDLLELQSGSSDKVVVNASGNLSVQGGINNNGQSITSTGAISGATTIAANNKLTLSGTGATELAVTGAPVNTANISLVQIGGAIASGNIATNGGTYLGINEPATGNPGFAADFFNLQDNGTSVLDVGSTGNLLFGNNADKTINFTQATGSLVGSALAITSGQGGNTGAGGNGGQLTLQGGNGGVGTGSNGGNLVLDAGAAGGTGTGGTISIGTANASGVAIGSATAKLTVANNSVFGSNPGTTLTVGANSVPNAKVNITTGSNIAFRAYQAGAFDIGQFAQTGTGTGTVATSNSVNLAGTLTQFTQYVKVGDDILVGNQLRVVATVTNDTTLTVGSAYTTTASGQTYYDGAPGVGAITTNGTTSIVGTGGTTFSTSFQPSDSILIDGETGPATIVSIADNSHMTLFGATTTSSAGHAYARSEYDHLIVKANGNVGIGTYSPTSALTVTPDGTAQAGLLVSQASGGTGALLNVQDSAGNNLQSITANAGVYGITLGNATDNPTVNINNTGTGAVAIGNTGDTGGVAINAGAASNFTTSAGALTLQGGGGATLASGAGTNISINPGTSGTVVVGTGSTTPTVSFGNANTNAIVNFGSAATAAGNLLSITGQTAGATGNNGGAITIQGGTATTTGNGGLLSLLGGASTGAGSAAGGITIDTGNVAGANVGAINIGSSNFGHNINIGNAGATGAQAIAIGGIGNAGNTVTIQGGTGTAVAISAASGGTINVGPVGATAANATIAIGTSSAGVEGLTIGSLNSTSGTTIQAGTSNLTLTTNQAGAGTIVKTATVNSTTAFQIQNASGVDVENYSTSTTNLVSQPDVTGATASSWSLKNGASAPVGDTTTPFETISSIKTIASGATAFSGLQTATFTAAIGTATQYQLTFWAKCSAAIATFTYGRQDVTGTDVNSTTTATCNTNWQQYTAHWTTGGTISTPNIYMDAGTPANATSIWVDGISLVQTSTSAATNYQPGTIYKPGVVASPSIFENSANSTQAFQVQNASGTALLNVDTTNGGVGIGTNIASGGRLAVVGATPDSTTNALNVTNSAGSSLAFVRDDGQINLGIGAATGSMGYTTIGGSQSSSINGGIEAQQFTTAGGGVATSITAYLAAGGIDPSNKSYQMAIYTDNGSNVPGTYIASTAVGTLSTAGAWYTLPLTTSTPTLSPTTKYWLVYWSNIAVNNSNNSESYDTVAGFNYYGATSAFGGGASNGFPTSWPGGGSPVSNHEASIYANLTGSGSALSINASGALNATGAAVFQDLANSSTAFQIQNATATPVLAVDTIANDTTAALTVSNNTGTNTQIGIQGYSGTNAAVDGQSQTGDGVFGYNSASSPTGYGVHGASSFGSAGYFQSSSNTNAAATLVVQQNGNGTTNQSGQLLQVMSWDGNTLIGTSAAGATSLTTEPIASSVTNGTSAPTVLNVTGGAGGATSVATYTAGSGSGISLQAGIGGSAIAGATNGNGGSVTLSAGAAGGGAGAAGTAGQVLVKNQTNAANGFQIQNATSVSLLNVNTNNVDTTASSTVKSTPPQVNEVFQSTYENTCANGQAFPLAPHSIGNLVAVVVEFSSSGGMSVSSITKSSGTASITWQASAVVSSNDTTLGDHIEIWYGTVTGLGTYSAAINFASYSSVGCELIGQEYSAGLGANTTWTTTTSGSNNAGSTSTNNFSYPTLTSGATPGSLYFGYAIGPNVGEAGYSNGFNYSVTPTYTNLVTYNGALGANMTYTPTAYESGGGTLNFNTAAMIISASAYNTLSVNGSTVIAGGPSGVAFQVQNSAGASLLNVDSSANLINLESGSNGAIGGWQQNPFELPFYVANGAAVSANGYVYDLAGYNNGSVSGAVYYAKINGNGELQNPTNAANTLNMGTTSSSAVPVEYQAAVTANGYVYELGGYTGAVDKNTVQYAQINHDGTLGAWQTQTTTLPQTVSHATAVAANGYIYLIGGKVNGTVSTNVYYGKVNADGTITSWSTAAVLTTALQDESAVFANGYITVFGGGTGTAAATTTVETSYLNMTNGSPGAFSLSGAQLTTGVVNATAAVQDGYVYMLGGSTNDTAGSYAPIANAYYGQLGSNGLVSSWTNAAGASALPSVYEGQSTVAVNGYIYIIGGITSSTPAYTTYSYYSSIPRVTIAGSLDLLGPSNSTLTDGGDSSGGSSGGSLTAGNTILAGTLQVASQANFNSGVNITGPLTGTTQNLNASAVSTGNALNISTGTSNNLTTGNLINVATTSNVQSAGSLVNLLNSTTLASSGGTVTANLLNVSRSVTSNVTGGAAGTIGFDNGADFDTFPGATTQTDPFTVNGGHTNTYMLIGIFNDQSNAPTSVTYNGVTATLILSGGIGTGAAGTYLYGLVAPATGTNNLVITGPAGSEWATAVEDFYNVSQATPVRSSGTSHNNTGPTATLAAALTTVAGDLVADFMADTTVSATSSQTIGDKSAVLPMSFGPGEVIQSYQTASTTTTNATYTLPGAGYWWGLSAVALEQATVNTETLAGSVASFTDNCALTAGSCLDGANVMTLTQQYSGANGTVLAIQNAGSGDFIDLKANGLTLDSFSNSGSLQIGPVSGNGSGPLLIVGNKVTANDPTGVAGAIYFNSAGMGGAKGTGTGGGEFRCYQGGAWRDCLGMPDLSQRRWGYASPAGATATTFTGTGLLGALTQAGGAADTTQTTNDFLKFSTTAVSGNASGVTSTTSSTESQWLPKMEARIRTSGSLATQRDWVALTNASLTGSDGGTNSFVGLRYSTNAADTIWQCVSDNGTAPTAVSTGVTVQTNTTYDVILDMSTSGTLVCSIALAGTPYSTVSTSSTLPAAGTLLFPEVSITTLTTTIEFMEAEYFYLEQN